MKPIGIIILMLMFMPLASSQTENTVDRKTQRQLQKEEKKKQREAEQTMQAALVEMMVNEGKFVLEADYLSNQYGSRVMVNSTINFIIVDSTQGVIQTASMSGVGGPNFMGGVTAEGTITQYEVTKSGKSKIYNVKMMIMTSIGMYDIFLSITPDGNATATIGGNWGGKLNYHGRLVPLGASKVYKGRSI
ncbi:MAG: DUF4251 domain-containing protein [Bacteroidales bacterium]|nr:DUF4251 domain-containing protein [Bacteroidales bacterium]